MVIRYYNNQNIPQAFLGWCILLDCLFDCCCFKLVVQFLHTCSTLDGQITHKWVVIGRLHSCICSWRIFTVIFISHICANNICFLVNFHNMMANETFWSLPEHHISTENVPSQLKHVMFFVHNIKSAQLKVYVLILIYWILIYDFYVISNLWRNPGPKIW